MNENQKNYLITAGIDLNTVINYTGDLQMYHEIILEFYEGLDEQFNTIKNMLEGTQEQMPIEDIIKKLKLL